jgi:hypothetical protein
MWDKIFLSFNRKDKTFSRLKWRLVTRLLGLPRVMRSILTDG